MARLVVRGFSISLDGYGAGPRQTKEEPLGVGGEELHDWIVNTHAFKKLYGKAEGSDAGKGADEDFAAGAMEGLGAWIMGRNMFGPIRGPWPDDSWRGWWGKNPPYHCPVFVLTRHPRPPQTMEGGTVFHFVTEGPEAALEQARAAAGTRDIRIGGGAATIREYLQGRHIDEMHLAVAPILLGGGESLLHGLDLPALGYRCTASIAGQRAMHYTIAKA
jgi:dihydrofolate reductase